MQVEKLSHLVEQVETQMGKIDAVEGVVDDQEKMSEWAMEQLQFESAHKTVKSWACRATCWRRGRLDNR